ncbi:TRAP transporter large permease subunit, partial [Arthrospira platensis SPKY2]
MSSSWAIALALLLALLLAGATVTYSTGALAMLGYILVGEEAFLAALPRRIFSQLDVFALMAMPLFILLGELMNRGGITAALIDFAQALVGHLRGALG